MHKFKARSPCGLKKCWSTTCKYSKNFFFRKNCLFVEDYQLSIAYSSYMTFNLHFNLYHQSFLSHPPFPYSAIAIGDHFPVLLSFALATPPPLYSLHSNNRNYFCVVWLFLFTLNWYEADSANTKPRNFIFYSLP